MTYVATQNAVCFENLKEAALYFDSVIPISFSSMQGRGVGKDVLFRLPDEIPGEVLVNLLFGVTPGSQAEKWTLLGKYLDSWDAFIKAIAPARDKFANSYEDVKRAYLANAKLDGQSSVREEFKKFSAALGKQYSTVLLPDETSEEGPSAYSALVLAGIPLVDTASLTWDQVLELRRDERSRASLRNLRLFFYTNYERKPTAFIADDLARRLDEYETTRKRLGFETVTGSISALIDAKSIQSAAAMGIAAAFVGGPVAGLTSAALFEISGMALELAKKRFAVREFEKNHELAYLIEARCATQ